jgi:phosphatidylinositol alpha-1,6-mannosyltransferase
VRTILHHAAAVTTVSTYTKQQLELVGVSAEKIALIHPCPYITPNLTPAPITCPPDIPVVLAVGRLVERKGFDTLLQAHKQIIKTIPDALLVIVGSGNDRMRLQQLVATAGMSHQVVLTNASDHELAAWYQRCTVFALLPRELPNHDVEGFGIIFLEAASFGKPVVAGRSGGVPDAVVDGVTGILVDPQDPSAVATTIVRLLHNPDQARVLGQAGQDRVARDFQWSVQAQKLEKLL